ncbi:MAG: FAD-dependent oxidoreductase [Candidatus Micrarchaeota archaeon]|nr:FAD-dependent oxidoreductase [Candidatus Micrarchaeota archaeon]
MAHPRQEVPKSVISVVYDILVVGSGVAGLAGGMYAGRLGLKTLVMGELRGGTITLTHVVENYPGFISLTGMELADKLEAHARAYPNVEIKDEKVKKISKKGNGFEIESDSGKYEGKTVLYATGTEWKKLGSPGEKEFASRGVHYCALCDGAFYKGKHVAVIGGSDSAAKDALLLTQFAGKVYIIYRGDKIRAEPANYALVTSHPKIEIIYNTNVLEIYGEKKAAGVLLDEPHNGSDRLPVDAVFVAIGHTPLSALAKEAGVEIDAKGYVKINRNSETNVHGFFAAGDVTDTRFKQAIVGVGEAVSAAYSAYLYLEGKK